MREKNTNPAKEGNNKFVSEKTLATQWDCDRSTIAKILKEAGVKPYFIGNGRKGLKRYSTSEVEQYLKQCKG